MSWERAGRAGRREASRIYTTAHCLFSTDAFYFRRRRRTLRCGKLLLLFKFIHTSIMSLPFSINNPLIHALLPSSIF